MSPPQPNDTTIAGTVKNEAQQNDDLSQDKDHKNEGGGATEERVEMEDLKLSEILPNDEGLQNFFKKFVQEVDNGKYANFKDNIDLYNEWYSKRILTRDTFRNLLNKYLNPYNTSNTRKSRSNRVHKNYLFHPYSRPKNGRNNHLQMKRIGNTTSYQKEYDTDNYGKFEEITYTRDNKGNINFSSVTSSRKWTNPVDGTNHVQLNKGLKDKQYGLTKNGTKIKIADGSRSQHFSIANRIKGLPSTGSPDKWTWHHKTEKYEMVLVDRKVHGKHGHNGGILLWK